MNNNKLPSNKTYRAFTMLFAFVALLTFSSCGDEPAEANLTFNLKFDGEALILGDTYQVGDPAQLAQIDIAQFYLNNIQLVNNDGTMESYLDHFLITNTNNEIDLGEIPSGSYTAITFDVGVAASANNEDPATYAADHPLAAQSPSMHWSWTAGYKFLRLDGQHDSNLDGTIDVEDEVFLAHVGLNEYLKSVELPYSFSASEGVVTELAIDVDFAGLVNYSITEKPEVRTGMVNEFHDSVAGAVPTLFSR